MLAYLSDEWVSAVDEALASAPPATPVALAIRQVVTGGRDGDRSYTLWFDGGKAGAGPEAPSGRAPDVTLTCDWPTAVAIATGKERAQHAFLAGRLRLGGDSRALLANAEVLAGLDDVLAAVRARTDFAA